jgi:hypothetical protein
MPGDVTPVEALAAELEAGADRLANCGLGRGATDPYRAAARHIRERLAPAWDELTAQRDRLAGTARLYQQCEAELQEVHDLLAAAYGRDDLSEDTTAVVAALIAERDRYRAWLAAEDADEPARVKVLDEVIAERDELRALIDAHQPTLASMLIEARAELAALRERLASAATGMETSAATSHPSKKSEIERGCAAALRSLAREALAGPS